MNWLFVHLAIPLTLVPLAVWSSRKIKRSAFSDMTALAIVVMLICFLWSALYVVLGFSMTGSAIALGMEIVVALIVFVAVIGLKPARSAR